MAVHTVVVEHPNAQNAIFQDKLQEVEWKAKVPLGGARMAAFVKANALHRSCCPCVPRRAEAKTDKRKQDACLFNTAVLLLRDLVVLTVALDQGPLTPETLKKALEDALRHGCQDRSTLADEERSQLNQAFCKVVAWGKEVRVVFDAKIQDP